MSWSLNLAGKSSKLAEVIKDKFAGTQGCPKGSAEEAAKNALGEVAETLCKSLSADSAVSITAQGSAWTQGDKALSQHCEFKLMMLGNFVE